MMATVFSTWCSVNLSFFLAIGVLLVPSMQGGEIILGRAVDVRLVEAECTAVEEHARDAKATLAIRHTYVVGRDERELVRFTAAYDRYVGSDIEVGPYWPPPKVGEIGLWAVELAEEGMWYPSVRLCFGVAWPIMASDKAQYALAKAFAEAVGDIAGRNQAEQLRALQQAAFGKNPLLACWAVSCLVKSPDIAESVLADLVAKCGTLRFEAQTVLDEALARAWGERWTNAGKRIGMLKGWTTREALEHCPDRVFQRLSLAYQRNELEPALLYQLIGSVAADPALPLAVRKDALMFVGISSSQREGRDKDKALAAVMLVLRGKDDGTDLRRRAAESLEHFFTLSPAERKVVQELRDTTGDDELAKILARVLEKKAE